MRVLYSGFTSKPLIFRPRDVYRLYTTNYRNKHFLNCPYWNGLLYNLLRKEKIHENNSIHFLFEKTNNSDVNPDIPLKDQSKAVIERLLKSIRRKNLGL